jgi:hypothetical protein
VQVKDLSWFGSAINIKSPLPQMCNPLGCFWKHIKTQIMDERISTWLLKIDVLVTTEHVYGCMDVVCVLKHVEYWYAVNDGACYVISLTGRA